MDKKMREFLDQKIGAEAHLEDYFCREVKQAGGCPIKFNPTLSPGLPDQIVFYKGLTWLVELKTPTGTVRPHQKRMHESFLLYGFRVRVIRTKEEVEEFVIDMLREKLNP